MPQSKVRYAQPLQNAVEELASEFDCSRYDLEVWAVLNAVLTLQYEYTLDAYQERLEQMLTKHQLTCSKLPVLHCGIETNLPK